MSSNNNCTLPGNSPTVAELAVSNPGALSVFTKYNIDYCCGGHRSIDEACMRVGLDPEKIKKEIFEQAAQATDPAMRPDKWTSSFLVDYIVQNHHGYVRNAIPEMNFFLDKVCAAHGTDCPELETIRELFNEVADELTDHMSKEELILFPAIKRLEARDRDDNPLNGTIQAPIHAMEHEHDSAGNIIKQIRALSNNYTPPDFACPTFKITFKKLQEFDNDLMKHIHLENNILFKRLKK